MHPRPNNAYVTNWHWNFMALCWSKTPTNRPPAKEAVQFIDIALHTSTSPQPESPTSSISSHERHLGIARNDYPRVLSVIQDHWLGCGMSSSASPTLALGRDADKLWKQYMRMPMSGPHPASSDASGAMPQPPSFRLFKTPIAGRDFFAITHGNGEGALITLSGNHEDLRSYKAAVNARNTSLNLRLPKRRGTRASPPAT